MAMQCISDGVCTIRETIFEKRDTHIQQLIKMGAEIQHTEKPPVSVVTGVKELNGAEVEAQDLRCGASLILAGLAAKGETIIKNSEYVERGYEKIEAALRGLGADIKLINNSPITQ